jgi:hypothetical protein
VPAVVNFRDAAWGVVEGDWGLYRPGHMQPSVLYAPGVIVTPPDGHSYYPHSGRRPRVGRFEVEPPPDAPLPPPAEPYQRGWGAHSAPGPVTEYPPFEMPDVIVEPRLRRKYLGKPK